MERIHAFSIALGVADAGLTERELETRKNEARRMALAFMPSLHALFSSNVEERLVADSGNLWLAFDLVPTTQMPLALDDNRSPSSRGADITRRLRDEFSRLREEAGEFVIRTGRLTTLANSLPQLDASERQVQSNRCRKRTAQRGKSCTVAQVAACRSALVAKRFLHNYLCSICTQQRQPSNQSVPKFPRSARKTIS